MITPKIAAKVFVASNAEALVVYLGHLDNALITQEVLQDRGLAHIID
jgi:hypothetical protein